MVSHLLNVIANARLGANSHAKHVGAARAIQIILELKLKIKIKIKIVLLQNNTIKTAANLTSTPGRT